MKPLAWLALSAAGATLIGLQLSHSVSDNLSKDMFASLLAEPRSTKPDLSEIGLVVDVADNVATLRETSGRCEGRGVYALRDKPARPLAITAPHSEADRNTGTLAELLFEETSARGAAWNSSPRRGPSDCGPAIDLADAADHPFTAFALAFAEAEPDGRIVQLHGFERTRRNTLAARGAAVIVSNGTDRPDAELFDLADCLSRVSAPATVLTHPGDTDELGALTNAQGRALREAGFAGFVHLELSAEWRETLLADGTKRDAFASCLAEVRA